MMGKRFFAYATVILVAVILRGISFPTIPFFCDVPLTVNAIESGTMKIQFPGYVPYHLTVKLLASAAGTLVGGATWFTMICGVLSVFLVMRTAEVMAGLRAAILAGIVVGWGAFGIYFSVTGTSYPADMLACAGILYHAAKRIYQPSSGDDCLYASLWCGLGILMRPLSSMWMMPAVLLLAWKKGGRYGILKTLGVLLLALLILSAVSAPYYSSWNEVVGTTGPVTQAATQFSITILLTNLFRLLSYPVYFFGVWLFLGAWGAWVSWRNGILDSKEKEVGIFFLILVVPYFFIMARHLPQAGYYCLVFPVICIFPLLSRKFFFEKEVFYKWGVFLFAIISLIQFFVLRPVAPTSLPRLVADAYFLQYSREAIQAGTFDTLSSLAIRSGVEADQVPEDRKQGIIEGKHK